MQKEFLEKLKTLKILYVEDEEDIRKKISNSLSYYVKEVIEAKNGKEGLSLYYELKPDIIFTDIMMPEMNGIELVKTIRKEDNKTPIVMVTAHTDQEYLLSAVQLHLEQYIVKPINLKELKNTLEKCIHVICENKTIKKNLPDGYNYDLDHKVLTHNNKEIHLTKKEIIFLELLLENKNRVVSYDELQTKVWEDDVMTDGALKSLIRNMRNKLPKDYIKNLSGIGYRIADY